MSVVAAKTAAALLRGARGNSGVILSLVFRGISNGFKGKKEVGGKDLAAALTLGKESAYKAVMKPTEGTILTVVRKAAAAAEALASETAVLFSTRLTARRRRLLPKHLSFCPFLKRQAW